MPGPKKSAKKAKERKVSQTVSGLEKRGHGGARPGAGHPVTVRGMAKRLLHIREITEDIIKSGKVPLRVMINAMIYYDEKAMFIQEEMEAALAENMKRFDPDTFQKCLELMVKMGDARMKAVQVASVAAPYVHPRLSSMEMNVSHSPKPKDIPSEEQTERFSDSFRQLRSQPYVIEQEVVDVEEEEEA